MDWGDLGRELDMWRDRGTPATLWWRDDDAIEPSQPLTRMLDMARCFQAPLALAVIPSLARPALNDLLDACCGVAVLQHGFSHINHAPVSEKKTELGNRRDRTDIITELSAGLAIIEKFQFSLPVLVPPWNSIEPSLLSLLPGIGFTALSIFNARQSVCTVTGLVNINTHADIIDWHHGRGFIGTSPVLEQIVAHLKARRVGTVEPTEPTGLLTHHLVHDEDCWVFLEKLLEYLEGHEGASLIRITGELG